MLISSFQDYARFIKRPPRQVFLFFLSSKTSSSLGKHHTVALLWKQACVATNTQNYVYPWHQGLRLSLWTLTCSSQKDLPLQENWVAQGSDSMCSHTLTLKLLIQGKAGSNWKLFQSWCQSGPSQVRKLCQKIKRAPLMKGLALNSKTALASSLNCPLIQGCLSASQMSNIIWGILHTLLFLLPSGLSRRSLPIWYLYTE